jgi:ubiquinone/menaquinone biosynthesis C-methylase UbiE
MARPEGNAAPYVLGHSDRELERLRLQAKLVDPITRQFLVEAGIGPSMRVLDIGCGAGDVTFLAASLVGPTGHVVGVDRVAAALEKARTRAKEKSLSNVTFRESDLAVMEFDVLFDAVIGRYVLCFQPDPVALLRKIAGLMRSGGVAMFHEPDRALMHSYPPAPTYDRACRWVSETYRRSGVDVEIGPKLYSIFQDAGLPAPTMRLHAIIGGACASDEIHLDADQAMIVAGDIVRLGVATADELQIGTLFDRIVEEMQMNGSVIVGRGEIGVWSRTK